MIAVPARSGVGRRLFLARDASRAFVCAAVVCESSRGHSGGSYEGDVSGVRDRSMQLGIWFSPAMITGAEAPEFSRSTRR